jgi:hypothetical protein
MAANPNVEHFAHPIDTLHPWLDQVVIIGGRAHRLYRLHSLARSLDYEPLGTLDTDAGNSGFYAESQNDNAIIEFIKHKQPLSESLLAQDEIAQAAVFLLSDAARNITGQVLAVDGGWTVSE